MGQLLDKQIKFSLLVARLIEKAYNLGYGVTFGDAYRDKSCPYGSITSLHKVRLAIDLNLYTRVNNEWKYLDKTEDHKILGSWWEDQDADCSWGGRFSDGNHYSLKHEGRR